MEHNHVVLPPVHEVTKILQILHFQEGHEDPDSGGNYVKPGSDQYLGADANYQYQYESNEDPEPTSARDLADQYDQEAQEKERQKEDNQKDKDKNPKEFKEDEESPEDIQDKQMTKTLFSAIIAHYQTQFKQRRLGEEAMMTLLNSAYKASEAKVFGGYAHKVEWEILTSQICSPLNPISPYLLTVSKIPLIGWFAKRQIEQQVTVAVQALAGYMHARLVVIKQLKGYGTSDRVLLEEYSDRARDLVLRIEAEHSNLAWVVETMIAAMGFLTYKRSHISLLLHDGMLHERDHQALDEVLAARDQELYNYSPTEISEIS